MLRKYSLRFFPVDEPIDRLVTKFGGQPVWSGPPCWPLSVRTRDPLRFVGQISLDLDIFADLGPRMAYLFTSELLGGTDAIWSLDDVESVVLLEPGSFAGPSRSRAQGPTVYHVGVRPGERQPSPMACEYRVECIPGEDPDPPEIVWEEHEDIDTIPFSPMDLGSKLGGVPGFLPKSALPYEGKGQLVLQLDVPRLPFEVNIFGAKMGYLFVSPNGTEGRMIWQGT